MKQAGIALLVLGLALTIVTSFSFSTKKEVVAIGELKVTRDEPHNFNWSPVAGIAVMGIGAVLVWQSSKRSPRA
ncbi:MAG: hypothetical protein Q8916_09025 [Bacteroidota bacterium]|nr:hypothetical protein [Bacteroidota bacterium]MDP4230528.1 hypothetical protein [Bacteroidota bacterium]MDP4235531.1 hypothetical protein [Bacteroidota bacterium]